MHAKILLFAAACIFIFSAVFCAGFVGLKFLKRIRNQDRRIENLMGKIDFLGEKLNQTVDYYNFAPDYSDENFNYFAIGNSLTLISSWGRGICSTQPDNDYFGLVKKYLQQKFGGISAYRYNFASWERCYDDRSQTFVILQPFLSEKLNLVTIQLGENAANTQTYESDLKNLISFVKQKCPRAKVIVVGDFWNENRNRMRKNASSAENCAFADLAEIIGDEKFQSGTGAICFLNDGTEIPVSKEASTHPGDSGMKFIAEKIIGILEEAE
jgi:hypothetical protein